MQAFLSPIWVRVRFRIRVRVRVKVLVRVRVRHTLLSVSHRILDPLPGTKCMHTDGLELFIGDVRQHLEGHVVDLERVREVAQTEVPQKVPQLEVAGLPLR